MLATWREALAGMHVDDVLKAAETHIELDEFFPKVAEFIGTVRRFENERRLEQMREDRTHAAFRCDGTGWRCARCKATECAVDCDQDKGMEPCPSCRPQQHEHFQDPKSNAAWRNGAKLPEAFVAGEPCRRMEVEPPAPPPGIAELREAEAGRWAAKLRDHDWSNSRRDLQ